MPETTSSGIEDPGAPERPAARVRTGTLVILGALLAAVLVVAATSAVWFAIKLRDGDTALKNRAAAASVAGQFALRMDNVDGTKFDTYIKSVNQLLTTKAKAKNSQAFDVLRQSYQATKVKGSGKVLLTAVGDSDPDSATVLVVHDADVTTTQGSIQHHYRWSISLAKVSGSWLVDDFDPVS